MSLKSAGGREALDVDQFDERLVKGSFTDAKGQRLQYVAYPAHAGAGIYEVTLDSKLKYSGTSTDGSKLDAQADKEGLVTGKLTTADDEEIPFAIRTLSLASPAELEARGLSASYRDDAKRSAGAGRVRRGHRPRRDPLARPRAATFEAAPRRARSSGSTRRSSPVSRGPSSSNDP